MNQKKIGILLFISAYLIYFFYTRVEGNYSVIYSILESFLGAAGILFAGAMIFTVLAGGFKILWIWLGPIFRSIWKWLHR